MGLLDVVRCACRGKGYISEFEYDRLGQLMGLLDDMGDKVHIDITRLCEIIEEMSEQGVSPKSRDYKSILRAKMGLDDDNRWERGLKRR